MTPSHVRGMECTGDGVSGYGNNFQRNDHLSSRRGTPKSKIGIRAHKCQFYN